MPRYTHCTQCHENAGEVHVGSDGLCLVCAALSDTAAQCDELIRRIADTTGLGDEWTEAAADLARIRDLALTGLAA